MSNTLFIKVDYTLDSLVSQIHYGQIGLPDIQRPFVWKNVKVRDLFDSMYRGYPVGYLLFWETGVNAGTKQIGTDQKQLAPNRVIVDGQQRLTSLYAVIKGIPVVRENYATEKIEIAFNPLEDRFEVPDAAILKSIAGFLNAKGGTLIVGVADNGTPVGLEKDGFADEDKMSLHLINLLKDRIGAQHSISIQPRFDDYGGVRVLVVECSASPTTVYVKDGTVEKFFVRYGPSTLELTGSAAQEYIKERF